MDVVNKELYQLEELLLHSVWLLGDFLRGLTQSVLILEIIICGNLLLFAVVQCVQTCRRK